MAAHSSVQYVEPNSYDDISTFTESITVDGKPLNKIIDPEEYCIGLSITTSLCNRGVQVSSDDTAVTLNCEMNKTGSKVSFMSGRLVKADNINGGKVPYLTTDYADMYVTDLKDYGTTQMIGIKSVNIDFENAVLPVITIQFTDVRGMSLFTPKEISRLKNLPNSGQANADDVARFFFQCFFKFPYPKFNITVKGFYGNPVSYEVTCDKFETNFNSETGDFDVTARFIGYRYSFLTDISLQLLLAAPYCDFIGKDYWEEKKQSDFMITDANGQKVKMPTLFEIRNSIKDILTNGDIEQTETTINDEEDTHDDERRSLEQIKETYESWYQELITESSRHYGNDHVFIEEDANGEYKRVIILLPSDYQAENMSQDFQQFTETKKVNNDLCTLIKKYNESYGQANKLNELSEDFSSYVKTPLFNELGPDKKYNGLVEDCAIPLDVVNRFMLGRHKDTTINTVFNNGQAPQHTSCFNINVDYGTIQNRINKLTEDSNTSYLEKKKKKEIHSKNLKLIGELGFNPTISNFTKIVMAHLETLMHMIYSVVNDIKSDANRTPSAWGASCGKGGTLPDVDTNATVIPPFPRVTKVVSENGVDKQQDRWIGELDKDSIKETDLIETFFNAIEEIEETIRINDEKNESELKARENENNGVPRCNVKYPTTPFDFFLDSKLYRDDVLEDINSLAGAVSIRMFDVLCLSFYANQHKNSWRNKCNVLGRTEAHNFVHAVDVESNPKIREWIKTENGEFNTKNILSIIKSAKSGDKYPWSYDSASQTPHALFDSTNWLLRYECKNGDTKSYMYPLQNISFKDDAIKSEYAIYKKLGDNLSDKNVAISYPLTNVKTNDVTSYDVHYNLIIENDFTKVKTVMDTALSESCSAYSNVCDILSESCSIDEALNSYYPKMFKINEVSSFCKKLNIRKNGNGLVIQDQGRSYDNFDCYVNNNNTLVSTTESNTKDCKLVTYKGGRAELANYFNNEIKAKNITSYFISEIFDYGTSDIDHSTSILNKDDFTAQDFIGGIDCLDYDSISNVLTHKWHLEKTFLYLPKLLVLQMGCLLKEKSSSDYNATIDTGFSTELEALLLGKYPRGFVKVVSSYLNYISIYSRMTLIKYWEDWVANEFPNIKNNLLLKNSSASANIGVAQGSSGNYLRVVLYENSPFVQKLTNSLMLPVLLVNGNINHIVGDRGRKPLTRDPYKLTEAHFQNYLDGFIDELNKILKVDYTVDSSGKMVKRAREASNTSNEMRIELYRYLKQIYDKWIPSSSESDWNFKNFFEDEGGTGDYRFYFIDSYYNKIGNKLLINPQELAKRLDTAWGYSDINSSVYSLLGWVFGDNRCMFKCIQNFSDFSDGKGIYNIFKPLPYTTAMRNVRQGSDFVVVYTYEPSKYLDIESSEYTNDGFMLNNELESPITIRSRGAKGDFYKIPAFGVTYGRQYQSYFKNISLDTKNAIQTQQAIFAKHAILQNRTSGNKFGVNGQDLFDIYTTQSYTCKVDMMGCAWIQPMMYFVLLNVPMFRGSYMIMKVNHKMTPGNMTTTFTGCRMANCANKFVEDIFISSDGDETQYLPTDESYTRQNDLADIDNDCPYYVQPIFSSEPNVSANADQMTKAVGAMTYLVGRGYSDVQAAGICGNIMKESGFDEFAVNNSSYAAGLCQWLPGYHLFMDMYDNHYAEFGYWSGGSETGLSSKSQVRTMIKERNFNYQLKFAIDSVQLNNHSDFKDVDTKLKACKTIEEAVDVWLWGYEKPGKGEAGQSQRNKFARDIYNKYKNQSSNSSQSEEATKVNEDIYPSFFNAVKVTCEKTPSIAFTPTESYYPNSKDKNKILMIGPDTKNASKLPKVFDCILNTPEYFKYVNTLYWVYDNAISSIVRIDVKLSNKEVAPNQQRIYWFKSGSRGSEQYKDITYNKINVSDLSDEAKKSLGKRYAKDGDDNKFKKLMPMLSDPEKLNEINITNCASVGKTSLNAKRTIGSNVGSPQRAAYLASLGFSSNPTEAECKSKMTTIKVETIDGSKSLTILNNQDVINEVKAIFKEIKDSGFKVRNNDTGAYCYRTIAGKSTLSLHSFGIAIDINWSDNPMIKGNKPLSSGDTNIKIRTMSSPVVKAFQNHGWGWGGRYGDYMHFSRMNGN